MLACEAAGDRARVGDAVVDGFVEARERLIRRPPPVIIPGHGSKQEEQTGVPVSASRRHLSPAARQSGAACSCQLGNERAGRGVAGRSKRKRWCMDAMCTKQLKDDCGAQDAGVEEAEEGSGGSGGSRRSGRRPCCPPARARRRHATDKRGQRRRHPIEGMTCSPLASIASITTSNSDQYVLSSNTQNFISGPARRGHRRTTPAPAPRAVRTRVHVFGVSCDKGTGARRRARTAPPLYPRRMVRPGKRGRRTWLALLCLAAMVR